MPRVAVQDLPYAIRINAGGGIDIPQTANLPVFRASGFTVHAKAKYFPDASFAYSIFSEGGASFLAPLVDIYFNGTPNLGTVVVQVSNDAGTVIKQTYSAIKVSSNKFYDIIYRNVNGECALYIDGVKDSANYNYTPSGTFTFDQTAIGKLRSAGGNYDRLNGIISSVQFFNRALADSEIIPCMNGVLVGDIGNYKLTEGSGTTATDSSDNGNNGTITSSTWVTDTPSKLRTAATNRVAAVGRIAATTRTAV